MRLRVGIGKKNVMTRKDGEGIRMRKGSEEE